MLYAFGGGSSGAGESARGARSAIVLATMIVGSTMSIATVRAPSGDAAHDDSAVQHGGSLV